MSSYSTRTLRAALLRKGFQQEKTHHLMFWLIVNGKRTRVRTRLSHGMTELGNRLLNEMAHQMMLSRKELDQFVQCPMDYHQYLQLIGARVVL